MDRMRHQSGFTILEMMIVLSIVALLFLLTLPNIQQKEAIIEEKGCEALTSVVDAQILLYEIDTLQTPTSVDQLISKGLCAVKKDLRFWKCCSCWASLPS